MQTTALETKAITIKAIEENLDTKKVLNVVLNKINIEAEKGNYFIEDLWHDIEYDYDYIRIKIEKYLAYIGYTISYQSNEKINSFDEKMTKTYIKWL